MSGCRLSSLCLMLVLCFLATRTAAQLQVLLSQDSQQIDILSSSANINGGNEGEGEDADSLQVHQGWTVIVPYFSPLTWFQQQWTILDELTSQLIPKCRHASMSMGLSQDEMLQQLRQQRLDPSLAELERSYAATVHDLPLVVTRQDDIDAADESMGLRMSGGSSVTVFTEYDGSTGASHSTLVEHDGVNPAKVTHFTTSTDGSVSGVSQQQPKKHCKMHNMMMSADATEPLELSSDSNAAEARLLSIPAHSAESSSDDDVEYDMDWSLEDDNGNINWGLIVMMLLCLATAAVIVSFLTTLVQLRQVMKEQQYNALDDDTLVVPLLVDHQWNDAKPAPVQFASKHVDPDVKTVDISYVVLSDGSSKA